MPIKLNSVLRRRQLTRPRASRAGLCVAGVIVGCTLGLPVVASAAPLTRASLEKAVKTPASQLTSADRAELTTALRDATVKTTSSSQVSTRNANAVKPMGVGACYGGEWTRYTLSTAGINLAWSQVGVGGWCAGPGGQAIVEVSGWSFPNWLAAPYCVAGDPTTHGPDGSYVGSNSTWAHGLQTLHVGISYAFGCAGLNTAEDALRIAYNGYWDGYDDFGY